MPPTLPTLAEIFEPALLAEMVQGGYVRTARHPERPLVIHNYTEKAQYEGVWNPVTLACRGLIADQVTGAVRARPFGKFFNHGQPAAPVLDPAAPVVVTEKMDGSLGVVYPDPAGGFAVATRGSFASVQAVHATALLRDRYHGWAPPAGVTVLVEIIYPDNRIVVDYQGLDDLVLLDAVDTATGRSLGAGAVPDWPGPVVARFGYDTFAQALAAPPRDGQEGLVVWFPDTDLRVKIKYPEYLRLHRLVTGLTTRTVWEHVAIGGTVTTLLENLPDEFHAWATGVATALAAELDRLASTVEADYQSIVDSLPAGWTRRDFAALAVPRANRGELFLRLDGRDYRSLLWQRIRPAGPDAARLAGGGLPGDGGEPAGAGTRQGDH